MANFINKWKEPKIFTLNMSENLFLYPKIFFYICSNPQTRHESK